MAHYQGVLREQGLNKLTLQEAQLEPEKMQKVLLLYPILSDRNWV